MADIHDAPQSVGRGLDAWQLDLAVALVLDDLAIDLPVAELAHRCGLSRSYFARAFKISMGLPPHRWLMRYRVERAREMLERTNEHIVQIALSCGFADQSHLTRVFHAITGLSPAVWRRQRKAGVPSPMAPEPPPGFDRRLPQLSGMARFTPRGGRGLSDGRPADNGAVLVEGQR